MGLRRRKLRDEEFYRIYYVLLSKYYWVVKYGRMPWTGHVAHVGWKRNIYRASMSRVLKEGVQLEILGIGGKIVLKKS